MTKLHKVNSNGQLSVILPKSESGVWEAGEEVDVETIGTDAILVTRASESSSYALNRSYEEMLATLEQFVQVSKMYYERNKVAIDAVTNNLTLQNDIKDMFNINAVTEQTLKNTLKTGLVKLIQQL